MKQQKRVIPLLFLDILSVGRQKRYMQQTLDDTLGFTGIILILLGYVLGLITRIKKKKPLLWIELSSDVFHICGNAFILASVISYEYNFIAIISQSVTLLLLLISITLLILKCYSYSQQQ